MFCVAIKILVPLYVRAFIQLSQAKTVALRQVVNYQLGENFHLSSNYSHISYTLQFFSVIQKTL